MLILINLHKDLNSKERSYRIYQIFMKGKEVIVEVVVIVMSVLVVLMKGLHLIKNIVKSR